MTVAGVATFAGNVSIAGTLTYEDVKNIDSVGLGTFREGIFIPDSKKIKIGNTASTPDIEIYHSPSNAFIDNHTGGLFIRGNVTSDVGGNVTIQAKVNENSIICHDDGAVDLYYNNDHKFSTTNDGAKVSGEFLIEGDTKRLFLRDTRGAGNTARPGIWFEDSAASKQFFIGNGSSSDTHLEINNRTTGDLIFKTYPSGSQIERLRIKTGGNIQIPADDVKLEIGASQDLELYHNGSNSYIKNDTGWLNILSDTIFLGNNADTKAYLKGYNGGSVEIFYNHSKKFETTNTGINVTGNVVGDGLTIDGDSDLNGDLDVDGHTNLDNVSIAGVTTTTEDIIIGADNKKLKLGSGEELQLYQAGNHSVIQHNGSHYLQLRSNSFIIMDAAATKTIFFGDPNGQSALYFNGSKKLNTLNGGVDITGSLQVDGIHCLGEINLDADIDVDGHTNLDNVSIAGVVTATSYYGDGSNLSNVISGVDLKFEGASVGTGVTMLNFVGFNTVTPPASGLSTITSGQNLTIGVRSGSAVEASLTGTSFNVIARSGGNISINI